MSARPADEAHVAWNAGGLFGKKMPFEPVSATNLSLRHNAARSAAMDQAYAAAFVAAAPAPSSKRQR